MKRKDFFKSLLGLAVAPLALSQTAVEPENIKPTGRLWASTKTSPEELDAIKKIFYEL